MLGTTSPASKQLRRSNKTCAHPKSGGETLRRRCSARFDQSSSSSEEEEFAKKIQKLSLIFQFSDASGDKTEPADAGSGDGEGDGGSPPNSRNGILMNCGQSEGLAWANAFRVEGAAAAAPEWGIRGDEAILGSMERRANSVDLPLSLRIIKRKKRQQWREGLQEAGESVYSSVKKAFSSMVFIIRELHAYTLRMRESISYEDLRDILARVQMEMHASFVWLFQQVFSRTPTLMVYVMILLANFTVHSMSSNAALAAAASPLPPATAESASVSALEDSQTLDGRSAEGTVTETFTAIGWTSVGGNNGCGGGGQVRPGADGGDGWLHRSEHGRRAIFPHGDTWVSLPREVAESVSGTEEEELSLWASMVEEARVSRDETVDGETAQGLVSPVTARIEPDDYADYFKTELLYRGALAQDPSNPLLLTNFAQFLCLVARDYDRAEEYFKRAVGVEPADAEAYSRYANFLWVARKDLWGAEEAYLEAISADPTNSFYAANYAHFLWSTGGEDTCFPLGSPECDPDKDHPSAYPPH